MLKRSLVILLLVVGAAFAGESVMASAADSASVQDVPEKNVRLPLFSTLFHDIGWNALDILTYGYGVPWAMAAGGTYAIMESGADWKWNRFCVRHETMSTIGQIPGALIGTFAPVVVPLVMYFGSDNQEYQLAGIAMGQAALMGLMYTSVIKAFTGRVPPHVKDARDGDEDYQDDYSKDFRFGFWRGGIFNGWPSGHTATATAMAVTLATLYPDNRYIFAGAIAYSTMVGVSMSFMAHWASDIFAGAITGFVIGRVVGKSFRNARDGKEDKLSFYAYPGGAGMTLRF